MENSKMVTESRVVNQGALTLPHINVYGYVGHATIFSWMHTQ